jgi:hypothetical protein
MLIVKHDNSNKYDTIKFNQLINELELFTGVKQNRINLNYRLLNNESIYINDFTYFNRIK